MTDFLDRMYGEPFTARRREVLGHCICGDLHSCSESDNQCPACIHLSPEDPCPVVGFGCGNWAGQPDCDCCTPEQREAATPSSGAGSPASSVDNPSVSDVVEVQR